MTIAPDTEVYYDPYDIGIVNEPYPVYARLRDEAPIYYNERYDFWAISRYADVEKALSDWETFSSSRGDILELVQSDFDMPKGVMMMEDPPVHPIHRRMLSRLIKMVIPTRFRFRTIRRHRQHERAVEPRGPPGR